MNRAKKLKKIALIKEMPLHTPEAWKAVTSYNKAAARMNKIIELASHNYLYTLVVWNRAMNQNTKMYKFTSLKEAKLFAAQKQKLGWEVFEIEKIKNF